MEPDAFERDRPLLRARQSPFHISPEGSRMKLYTRLAVVLCSSVFCFSVLSSAQTLALNDRSIILNNPDRIGINLGTINYYDSGQLLKNLIGSNNPGMEPLLDQQIWV